jgi:aspartyl-tRNA(Asn)/glutamyl-tRNA(Gln) amidotransferase subunit B
MEHIVIGLEVHAQLLTRTKLFCGCSTTFGLPPNSATCPVCIGMPGVMPVMNRRAFQLALKAAVALDCKIAPFTKWDRKNYFYPDLPKAYQISQYDLPFSSEGKLAIETSTGARTIGIIRAHLEEDAGKMLHDEQGGGRDSLVDLNRAGTPLLEIVSKPEMTSAEEAKAYLEAMRLILRETEISDCEMQEGSLRCDANINLHIAQPDGSFVATPIIEVKNLNSFRGVEKAMEHEAERQREELAENLASGKWRIDKGTSSTFAGRVIHSVQEKNKAGVWATVSKTTAGWNDVREVTEVQRRKEEAADYRYFPEPDLVPVTVDAATVERVRGEVGELPAARKARLQSQYALSEYDANVLTQLGRAFVDYFETVAQTCGDGKEACNWITNHLLASLKERKLDLATCPLPAASLGELIKEAKAKGINKPQAREVFADMLDQGLTAADAIEKRGIKPMGDETQLREMIQRAIAGNAKAIADYRKGKLKAADAIKGAVMKETKGSANMEVVQRLLLEELAKLP